MVHLWGFDPPSSAYKAVNHYPTGELATVVMDENQIDRAISY